MITRIPIRIYSSSTICRNATPLSTRFIRSPNYIFSSRKPLRLAAYSTASPNHPPPPPTAEPIKPTDLRSQLPSYIPPPPKPKRSLRPYIYATLFLLLGVTAGSYARLIIAPLPLPLPGTREDELMVEYIQSQAEKLPIVQSLSTDPNWTSYEAYSSLPEADRAVRLTTGPLAGARALGGFQRVFYNAESGETIVVVWLGGGIAGWPGVVHGGVIATILDESLARCALKRLSGGTGVTANLDINYLKPVVTNGFYVVRCVPDAKDKGNGRKEWVTGRFEGIDGRIHVEAKALYVVPKSMSLKPIGGNF